MKAALYCRLSEEDQNKRAPSDDSESIQNQKSMLLQYVIDKGWDVYDIYSDDDYTGADRNRPEWNRLINDAKLRKFEIVLCKTQSRFTRELEMVEKYIHGLFPQWGIRFIGIVDNADTDVKGNKKSRQINGLVNEWYLEDMSENIKSVLNTRRENGLHIGSFALYGYQKDPFRKGHLIIDEDAAVVVREVFNLFAQGYGKTTIARRLNDRGIPNPTEYKRLKNLRYKPPTGKVSTLWKYYAISDMLTNEIYIGNMVQGKYGSVSYKTKKNKPRAKALWIRVENTHEPIIERALWDQVQARVREKAKPFGNGKIGLFAKKVRCRHCGYVMRSAKSHGHYYLKCGTKHTAKEACLGSFISANTLEKVLLNELKSLMRDYLDITALEQQVVFRNKVDEKIAKLQAESVDYDKKRIEYAGAIKEIYLDKIRGILSESEFLAFSREFSAERERLEQRIRDVTEEVVALEHERSTAMSKRQLIDKYINTDRLDRDMIDKLIDHISVSKRDPVTKQLLVEIHWNF